VFHECLAFLQGGRARGRDVDIKLCEIADGLLDQLSYACGLAWGRFTILADEEFFSDYAQIIRIRFPFHGIWDLPVAAHEFGHFAAHRLTAGEGQARSLPFPQFVTDYCVQNKLGREWALYLNEFFADAFATYTLGPSYAFTSLLLRFGVATAHDEVDQKHPSYAKRAQLILDVLNRMDCEADSKGALDHVIRLLRDLWDTALNSAEMRKQMPDADGERLGYLTGELYGILTRTATHARYNRWDMTAQLQSNVKAGTKAPTCEYEVRDLLNAAWRARFEPNSSPEQISGRVICLAMPIVRNGAVK
jgi:hypothetical protein